MALSHQWIRDVDTLKAFAHPLRMRLLGALREDGPATASELGRRLGESSGSTSYHLRQLQRFGFIAEDTDQTSRRERRWRATHDVTSWHTVDFLADDGARASVHALQQEQLGLLVDRLQHWYAEQNTWSPEWIDAAEHSDLQLRMSPEELKALGGEVRAVIQRHVEGQRSASDPDAVRVAVHLVTFPVGDGATGR